MAPAEIAVPDSHGSDSALVRAIGPWALGATAVNLTVGAGIFALPALVAALLGPAAIMAYLVCGALMLLVLACFAEVGTRVTRSGGAVAYIEEAFGPLAGFTAWVVFALAYATASDAAVAHVFMDAAAVWAPALREGPARAIAFVVLFAGLVAVNVRGVRQGATLSVVTTVGKLLPILFLVAVGALAVQPDNLRWTDWPTSARMGEAALLLFFAFGGAETALTPSGEIRDPARTVPRGILGAIVGVILLYAAIQLVAQGVLGSELATGGNTPLADLGERVAGAPGRALILACTAVSTFGLLAADLTCTPRSFLVAAESGLVPRALGRVHPRFRTPHVAIAVYGALILALALTGGFRALAVLASLALLLTYLAVCLAALKLRYTRPPVRGTFRAPGGPTVALLASGVVLWLVAHSTRRESLAMAAVIALAALYYLIRRRTLVPRSPSHG